MILKVSYQKIHTFPKTTITWMAFAKKNLATMNSRFLNIGITVA